MANSLKKDRELRAKIVINEVSRLTELSDCPSTLVGQALKVVRVNAGETELEFATIAGGGDMLKSENLSGLADYPTARTNLGINTTVNQTDSADKRFVTDAEKIKLSNTSGTNTGDQDLSGKQNVLVSGTNIKTINGSSVLGSGDLVVSGATSATETEIDFGSTPVSEALFTITDAAITATKKIMCSVSYAAPTGKDQDELEMDDLQLRAVAGTGNFALYVRAADGSYLADKFKIYYIIAA